MQTLKMSGEEIRHYVANLITRHLRNVPDIALPLPTPSGDPGGPNWHMDLAGVEMQGFDDLIRVVIEDARTAVFLMPDGGAEKEA
jgi:hypothetical protein